MREYRIYGTPSFSCGHPLGCLFCIRRQGITTVRTPMKIFFTGTLNRLDFFLKNLLSYVVFWTVSFLGIYISEQIKINSEVLTNIARISFVIFLLYTIIFQVSLYIRRGNDFGNTKGWSIVYYLVAKIPILGLIVWWQYQFTQSRPPKSEV